MPRSSFTTKWVEVEQIGTTYLLVTKDVRSGMIIRETKEVFNSFASLSQYMQAYFESKGIVHALDKVKREFTEGQ